MIRTETLKMLLRPLAGRVRRVIADARWTWYAHRVCAVPRRLGEQPRVSYAHAGFPKPLPGSEAVISGGAVKYRYLNRRLPHAGLSFDILYVVSSSYCPFLDKLMQVAQRRGAKVVWNQNGVFHPQSYLDAPQLNAWMARLYKRADYVFYQSQFCLDSAQLFLGERVGPGEVLYNAIDTTFFVPPLSRIQRKEELHLLMAGTHYSDYRLPCGIRTLAAVRRTRPARLLIAGSMVKKLKLEARKLVAGLNLEPFIDFLGPYRQDEAPTVLQQGDIYLHTKYIDPSPSAVIEAMACGLPVVCSKTGGTAELVGDEAGLGMPAELDWSRDIPPDPEQLAACVLEVADSLPYYSQAARERAVMQFDLVPWLERHAQVFEMLMEE